MIQLHNIKIELRWADAKLDGDKLFEVRPNDRYYQKGDLISYSVLTNREGNIPNTPIITHRLNNLVYEITYVYSGPGVEQGYVVLGERDVTEDYINHKGKFANLQQSTWNTTQEDE